jgi:hypothetical protein
MKNGRLLFVLVMVNVALCDVMSCMYVCLLVTASVSWCHMIGDMYVT